MSLLDDLRNAVFGQPKKPQKAPPRPAPVSLGAKQAQQPSFAKSHQVPMTGPLNRPSAQPIPVGSMLADLAKFATQANQATYGTALKLGEGFAKGAISTGQRAANTLGAGATGGIILGQAGYDKLTGSKDYQNNLNAGGAQLHDYLNRKTITGAPGSFISEQQAANKNNDIVGNFIKPIVSTANEVAPYVVPVGGIGQTGKLAVRAGKQALLNGGMTAATDSTNQLLTTGRIDPKELAKNTAMSAAVGAAIPAAGAAVKGAKPAAQAVAERQRLQEVRNAAAATPTWTVRPEHIHPADINKVKPEATQAAVKEILNGRLDPIITTVDADGKMTIIDGFDRYAAHQKLETQRIPVKRITMSDARMMGSGGYIAGPGAKGFNSARDAGRVFDGVDGKKRFEVTDHEARLVARGDAADNLNKLLDHPTLFENYPHLKDTLVDIKIDKNYTGADRGYFDPSTNSISIVGRNHAEAKKTLLHEIQHGIQEKEGFAKGTNQDAAYRYQADILRNRNAEMSSEQTYNLMQKINDEVDKAGRDALTRGKTLTGEEKVKIRAELRNKYFGEGHPLANESAFNIYRRHAGEAEARAVAERRNMTDAERYTSADAVETMPAPKKAPAAHKEKALNLQDKDDAEYLARILGEDRVNLLRNGDYSHWRNPEGTLKYWEDQAKVKITDGTPQTIAQKLEGRIRPAKLNSNKLYHGTSADNKATIMAQGFKNGAELPEEAFRSGGFGAMQHSISFSTDPKIASTFTGSAHRGVVLETSIKKDAKVVTIDGIDYAEDFNDMIPELRKQGIDAVYLPGEKEIAVINPTAVEKVTKATEFTPSKAKEDLAELFNQPSPQRSTFYDSLDVPKDQLIVRGVGEKASSITSIDDIENKYKGVDLGIYEGDKHITLSKIIVPKDARGSGQGTKVMKDLTDYADTKGKRIVLTPSKDYGGSVARLKEFYKRFGFVENSGRNKDFSTRESMYREPVHSSNTAMSIDPDKVPSFEEKYLNEQVASHSSPDKFMDDIVERIWQNNKKGAGTEIIHNRLNEKEVGSDAFAGSRISNNNPFYRDFYAKYNRAPRKTDIKDMVQEELTSKRGSTLLTENEVSPVDADIYHQLKERTSAPIFGEPVSEAPAKKQLPATPVKTVKPATKKPLPVKAEVVKKAPVAPAKLSSEEVHQYVNKQVKAQQSESKTPLKKQLNDFMDNAKHTLVDDAVAYERYVKDKGTRIQLREGVDRVRNSSMIARSFAEDGGMAELGKMSTKDLNEFQQYLIAKRGQELDARGLKTGRDPAADGALINTFSDKFKKQEKIVRDYSKTMLDYSVSNGLISKELRNSLLKESPNYVPMNRVMDAVESNGFHKSKQLGSLSKQTVVQKLVGSERTVANPVESLLLNTERMINEAQRNQVARKLAETDAFKENVLKEGEKARPGNDTLSYLHNGKKVTVEVPELVAREMKNLNGVIPDYLNTAIKIIGTPTQLLRTGATSANPIFALSNVVRDQIQTTITGNVRANIKGTPKAIAAAFDPGNTGARLRAELRRNGIIGSEYRQTYGHKPGQLMKELQGEAQLSKKAMNKLRHPIDALADLIGTTENFTRAQQFYGTKGDIATKSQAARNNTLNFGRAGVLTRQLNRIIPFINAGVQGGRVTVNQFKQRPVRTAAAFATLTGVALAAKAYNTSQNEDLYKRLSEEEKKNNLIIFSAGAHYDAEQNRVIGLVKIPMPQMVYPLLDAVNNVKGTSSDFARIAGDIFTAGTGIDATNPINQLTPTAVKPIAEIGLNKSFYSGQDIVSDFEKNFAPEDKGANYSTGLARKLAETTGAPAPWFDNIIGNYGGGLAKDLSKAMTNNPDNTKDGRGALGTLQEGYGRRFGSSAVTSQYDIQAGLAETYKKQLKSNGSFSSLPKDEQAKLLDKVDMDTKALAGVAAKTEQNRGSEIKKDLTTRQKSLAENGFNADTYLKDVAKNATSSTGSTTKVNSSLPKPQKEVLAKYDSLDTKQRDEWFNKENDAEYKYAQAKYLNDKASGSLSQVDVIKTEDRLAKLQAGSTFSKETRDLYSLSKAQLTTLIDNGKLTQKQADSIISYGDALEKVGSTNKLRDTKGNVAIRPKAKGSSKKKLTLPSGSQTSGLASFTALNKKIASAKVSKISLPKVRTGKKPSILAYKKSTIKAPKATKRRVLS
jgi:predicted GNAT superfamily acetyltransferase